MPDPAPIPSLRLTDFSDRLSPMLVKELRQGMRTNLFTIAFILLQAFMVLCVLIGASAPGDASGVSGFFWFFVIVALLIVMPIRGFSALTSEINLNTMDLIQLTKLGAWRVTFGKWAALVAQTLLLACGILPYLVMRYFFGGIDLINDLFSLFWVIVISMVLTAITVGFSAFRSVLLRATVAVGIFIAVNIGTQLASSFTGLLGNPMASGLSGGVATWTFLGSLLSVAYLGWFMLDLGASRIAPEAENHATRKRVMALGFGLFILLLPLAGVYLTPCLVITGILWMLVSLDALTERPSIIPSILRPFATHWYLRPFSLLLTPGWPSGIFYYLLCATLFTAAIQIHTGLAGLTLGEIQITVGAAGMIVFPLIIIHLFFRRITEPASIFGVYLLIQVCSATVAFLVMIMAEQTGVDETAYLFAPIPVTALFAGIADEEHGFLVFSAAAFGVLAVLVTMLHGLPWYRDTFRVISQLRAAPRD